MKKLLIFTLLLFSNCSPFNFDKYNGFYENAEYTENFKDLIGGEIHPEQTWGFEETLTRSASPNANQWSDTYIVPEEPTQEEIDVVISIFKSNPNLKSITVNWSEFFVFQVYKSNNKYIGFDQNNAIHEYNASNQMNYLVCGDNDHIFNFNSGDASNNGWYGKSMLMVNSSTTRFGFHNSGDNKIYYNYCIIEYKGNYYVGFDYENHMNGEIDRDFFYDDWIVRISPAISKNAIRIMGEDLGTTDDFDFNDIVFDVWFEGNTAIIVLRAAGGTLPIYLDYYEIHSLFGVEHSKMVNTGSGPNKPVVIFRLEGYSNPNDIPIKVNHLGFTVVLQAPKGKTPQKFACPITVDWTSERQSIINKYPEFSDWARLNICFY